MGVMLRRVVSGLALAGLAVGLTACGVARTIDPVAAAATKTERAGGYKVSLSGTVTSADMTIRMSGNGVFDDTHGELALDVNGLDLNARYLTEHGDFVMYINLGAMGAGLPNGKSWIRLDLEEVGNALGIDLSKLMSQGATQTPLQSLETIKASGDFAEVGSEELNGTTTTHYHGTVDLLKAAKNRGLDVDAVQKLIDAGARSEYPMDVWVDDSGYIVQYRMTLDQKVKGVPSSMVMTMGMSDFGTPVDVAAPPSSEVFDVTSAATPGVGTA
jgi:LppX_LprAFG lipoprotein